MSGVIYDQLFGVIFRSDSESDFESGFWCNFWNDFESDFMSDLERILGTFVSPGPIIRTHPSRATQFKTISSNCAEIFLAFLVCTYNFLNHCLKFFF